MEVAVDFEDEQTIYTTYIYGQLYRSDDQWDEQQYYEITPPGSDGGDWVTPYVLDPQDSHVIVAGYSEVFRSDDRGETWQQLSNDLTGDPDRKLNAVAVAPTDQYTIYAGRGSMLYITHDAGESWDNESVLFGAGTAEMTTITVDPNDPNELWVTLSGYVNGKKVYHSTDAGITFSNVTFNLPNIPVNAAVIDKQSAQHDFYIGTDVGVFILDEENQTWMYYGAGLPNTMVSDLEIQYSSRKLRIGTFGRGVWENDLYSTPDFSSVSEKAEMNATLQVAINPVNDVLLLNVHNTLNAHGDFVVYDLLGRPLHRVSRTLHAGHYQFGMQVANLPAGSYLVGYESNESRVEGVRFIKR
jgi:ligand-binding sensor domain-containing protein